MQDGENVDTVWLVHVEDQIRKADDNRTPDSAVDDLICFRKVADACETVAHCVQKLIAEAWTSRFVPLEWPRIPLPSSARHRDLLPFLRAGDPALPSASR